MRSYNVTDMTEEETKSSSGESEQELQGKNEMGHRETESRVQTLDSDSYKRKNMSDIPMGVKLSCNSLFSSYSNTVMHTDNYNSAACAPSASVTSTSN